MPFDPILTPLANEFHELLVGDFERLKRKGPSDTANLPARIVRLKEIANRFDEIRAIFASRIGSRVNVPISGSVLLLSFRSSGGGGSSTLVTNNQEPQEVLPHRPVLTFGNGKRIFIDEIQQIEVRS